MKISWGSRVAKQLGKLPAHISRKYYAWTCAIELVGIASVRKSPGFHDEPLFGTRLGQRSVRLNRSYRVIYMEKNKDHIEVLEVNKHVY